MIARKGTHRNIILGIGLVSEEVTVVQAGFDAAGNRPQWLKDSDVDVGAALNIFGNFGVNELTSNQLNPDGGLDNEVAGTQVIIEQGGAQFPAGTAWIAPNQAVSIGPLDLQYGEANVFMRKGGVESNRAHFTVGSNVGYFT